MLAVLFAWAAAAATPPASTGETGDTGIPDPALDQDQDGDGFTPNQGDCDDQQRDAAPGLIEVCADRIDNDCNGRYDDGCDDSVHLASLRGGGGCTGGGGIAGTQTVVVLTPLLAYGWRRGRRS